MDAKKTLCIFLLRVIKEIILVGKMGLARISHRMAGLSKKVLSYSRILYSSINPTGNGL